VSDSSRVIDRVDFRPEQTWQLLAWCIGRGADEFTVSRLGLEGHETPFCDAFEAVLSTWRRPAAMREGMSAPVGQPIVRSTDLWNLRLETVLVLREYFDSGLFTYSVGDWKTGCLEDPVFYRRGELLLGILSHESYGVLAVTEQERLELAAIGIRTRDQPEWMGGQLE
jgi:hypothetical protein